MYKSANQSPKLAESFASAFIIENHMPNSSKGDVESNSKFEENRLQFEAQPHLGSAQNSSNHANSSDVENVNLHQYLPILSLPEVVLEEVLSYLTYDQVAQMRVICKR